MVTGPQAYNMAAFVMGQQLCSARKCHQQQNARQCGANYVRATLLQFRQRLKLTNVLTQQLLKLLRRR